jgi:hypothetical protein
VVVLAPNWEKRKESQEENGIDSHERNLPPQYKLDAASPKGMNASFQMKHSSFLPITNTDN